MNWFIRDLFWPSGIHKTGLGSQEHHPRSIFNDVVDILKCKCVFVVRKCVFVFSWFSSSISTISRVWKRRETLFGVDRSKNFGVSSVLDLFGERNKVFKYRQLSVHLCIYLISICLSICLSIKYLSTICPSIYPSIYRSIYLSTIYPSLSLSIYPSIYYLSIYLSIYLSMYLSVGCFKAARSAMYIYIYMYT